MGSIKSYTYTFYWKSVIFVCLFIVMMFFIMKNKIVKKQKLRPEENQIHLDEIVEEIHYSACYCTIDPSLIERCILLLQKYPQACNIPLPNHNYTPFLRACWNGCAELISYMIQNGAYIDAITDAGEGGIYLATYYTIKTKDQKLAALKILIKAGLNINAARHDGFTALHLAASRGCSRVVRWLLAHGANPRNTGRIPSPYQLALACGHYKTASYLKLPKF